MEIDRSNYEAWLIDWLDGNLNPNQIEQLQSFLTQNPDLKEEFDELTIIKLTSQKIAYDKKIRLKKQAEDLSELQFEFLCTAYLENDLSEEQKKELLEIAVRSEDKKMSFDLIQKTKLSPSVVNYKHKKRLIKRNLLQKALRISYICLSAAAIIFVALITYFSIPQILKGKSEVTSLPSSWDSAFPNKSHAPEFEIISVERKTTQGKSKSRSLTTLSHKTDITVPDKKTNQPAKIDSIPLNTDFQLAIPGRISLLPAVDLKTVVIPDILVSSITRTVIQEYDDSRSKLGRYLAKTFREKILKEKSPKDNPLKGYEIAEAGVSGLNKLLGWEMSLEKKNGVYGELKSVYFTSKILKFNAPVRKKESIQ